MADKFFNVVRQVQVLGEVIDSNGEFSNEILTKLNDEQQKEVNNKSLTIEELKKLEVSDWIWVVDLVKNNYSAYVQKDTKSVDNFNQLSWVLSYSDYGKKWIAYKNKEEVVEGKVVYARSLSNGEQDVFPAKLKNELKTTKFQLESGQLKEDFESTSITLPCKIGDTVYCLIAIDHFGAVLTTERIIPRKVTRIIWDGEQWEIHCASSDTDHRTAETCDFCGFWNNIVFATREQAEAKLNEIKVNRR